MKVKDKEKRRIEMNGLPSNPEVMTVAEMAAHLHVPKSTARKIIRRGKVRHCPNRINGLAAKEDPICWALEAIS